MPKPLINQHFQFGGGYLPASGALLAAILLGAAPVINDGNGFNPLCSAPAQAAELEDVDLSKIPLDKPTLDYLHENNVQIPQSEYDDEGNLVESGSILAPESAYTLTEVQAGEDGAAPAGDNIITKYELKPVTHYYDPVTGKEVAEADRLPDVQYKEVIFNEASQVYYQLNLKQTTYGEGNQSYSVTLETPPVKDVIINVLYDNTNTSQRITVDSGTDYGDITSNFIGNSTDEYGGAIYNRGTIGNITSNFIGNSAKYGGAIYNYISRTIGNITGDFIGNSASYGGAIYNVGTIGDITGDFIGNSANSYGGAIANYGTIGDITGDFIGNSGMAIYNDNNSSIGNITGDFISNINGGINNTGGNIEKISGNFIGNKQASAIHNYSANDAWGNEENLSTIYKITGNFINNTAGAIENTGYINEIKGNFINNEGGAISSSFFSAYMHGPYFNPHIDDTGINKIVNSSFFNNYNIQGAGAIYSNRDINIVAEDGGYSVFSGNYIQSEEGSKDYQAIFIEIPNYALYYEYLDKDNKRDSGYKILSDTVSLTLNANTNGTIIIDDKISGASNFVDGYFKQEYNPETGYYERNWIDENGNPADVPEKMSYSLNITGDATGQVILNNTVDANEYEAFYRTDYASHIAIPADIIGKAPVNISLEKTNLYLGARDDVFNGNNLDLKSGSMSMVNDATGVSALNSLTVSGDTNFVADVDLANKEMDRFTAGSYGEHKGNLNVIGLNLLSDANMDEDVTAIYFAEPGLKNNVVNAVGELPGAYQTAYTPIYKYNFIYDTENEYDGKGDGGYFIFTRGDKLPVTPGGGGGSTGNDSDAFNPAVLATPVGNLAAGQAAVNEAFKYVFEHADAFTQLPSMERYAKINANKYALSTDFNDNMPSYAEQLQNKAVWFRPYTTFESMNLDNGPDVDAITYGSLVGFDGDFKEMKNGWHRVFTGYAGYMGSSLNYSGVDTTMNGGLLGFTETFYKGNFWTAITASAGASVGESHTMYGKEDYTSLLAGVGSKTGYNFEFKDGKFIIQPIMYLSYTFVNTFDYKNAAGVNIESDPLHTIQLNPSVRFIANLKGGWQPYASVGMVWNLMNESKVTANNVKLPEMSVKPYVEYGVGVQRNWADKFTAFLQAMIRNGGRNGIALTGGFRFMLGSDNDNSDKPKVKKEIKSL